MNRRGGKAFANLMLKIITWMAFVCEALCVIPGILICKGIITIADGTPQSIDAEKGIGALLIVMAALAILSMAAMAISRGKEYYEWSAKLAVYPAVFFLLALLNEVIPGMDILIGKIGSTIIALVVINHASELWKVTVTLVANNAQHKDN